MRTQIRTLTGAAALALLAATGCGGDGGRTSPFTGERGDPGPVVAVKIDNAPGARPQTGLDSADLVYAEEVEGGLSRLVGVWSGTLPGRIGPVRSARESDLELLAQFGRPVFAYSGAQETVAAAIRRADVVAASPDAAPRAYERDGRRASPHNLYVRPEELLDTAEGAGDAPDAAGAGLRFGAAPGSGGEPARTYDAAFPQARFTFRWSADEGRWRVLLDGDAVDARPATVVVQRVTVRESALRDANGNPTPYTETVGSGGAVVLRDGRAYDGRWERPDAEAGTEFTTPGGDPLRFARGPVWIVLDRA
ncbi:DUF3048 domain-containing protein [Streptomyces avicenniae]|uniref:DUF3048 domain-containing protein n=1 Tax=Streptomyces avicenniae TaxID=500153 RepID=UPI000AE9384C|nr:DUF3048 domain-containing protein [Streptomyces avicenniae]